MYCNHCGEKRETEGRFCVWCGKEFLTYTGATERLETERTNGYIYEGTLYFYASGLRIADENGIYKTIVSASGLTYSAPNIVITVDAEISRQLLLRRLQSVDRDSVEYWHLLEKLGLL